MGNKFFLLLFVAVIADASINSNVVLDYQGRITHAVGTEHAKETLPCSVTIGKLDDDKATFFFSLGAETSTIHGTRETNDKRWNSNLVYNGPKKKVDVDLIRYEKIELDIRSDRSEIELNRKVFEYKENSFYSATLSNVTCKAKLVVLSED